MRKTLIAVLLLTPSLALAQTPRDLARLTWPLGVPDASSAIAAAPVLANAASAQDLARLSAPAGYSVSADRAPVANIDVANGATAVDLVRLTGVTPTFAEARGAILTLARATQG
jgi:hypothetical protein